MALFRAFSSFSLQLWLLARYIFVCIAREKKWNEGRKASRNKKEDWRFGCQVLYSKLNRNLCLPNYHRSVRKKARIFQLERCAMSQKIVIYLRFFSCSLRRWKRRNVFIPFVTRIHIHTCQKLLEEAQVFRQALEMNLFSLAQRVLEELKVSTQHICHQEICKNNFRSLKLNISSNLSTAFEKSKDEGRMVVLCLLTSRNHNSSFSTSCKMFFSGCGEGGWTRKF